MSTLSKTIRGWLGGAALIASLGAAGCVSDDHDGSEDSGPPAPIASLDLGDGGQVDFYEPEPGRLLVFTRAELSDDVEHMQPQAMYEALAGRGAPQALREAQVRADQARAALRPGDDTIDQIIAPDRERGVASLTASQFQSSYCNPGAVDFDYCWPNSTNNYSIDISSVDWIHAHIDTLSGTLTMSMYYRTTLGNWILMFSDNVSSTSSVITQSTTDNDRYLVQLSNATGDTYHLAIHGDK